MIYRNPGPQYYRIIDFVRYTDVYYTLTKHVFLWVSAWHYACIFFCNYTYVLVWSDRLQMVFNLHRMFWPCTVTVANILLDGSPLPTTLIISTMLYPAGWPLRRFSHSSNALWTLCNPPLFMKQSSAIIYHCSLPWGLNNWGFSSHVLHHNSLPMAQSVLLRSASSTAEIITLCMVLV